MADKQVFIDAGPKKPNLPHSNFDVSYVNNMTARFGRCYPVYCRELPAGARLTIKPSMAFDMMPLVYPIQTNVRAHLKFYKVPMRILWDKYEDFMSAVGSDGLPNNSSAEPYVMPYIKRQNWTNVGSLAESMGVCGQKYDDAVEQYRQFKVTNYDAGVYSLKLDSRILPITLTESGLVGLFEFSLVLPYRIESGFGVIQNGVTVSLVRGDDIIYDGFNFFAESPSSVISEQTMPLCYNSFSGNIGIRLRSTPTILSGGTVYVYRCYMYCTLDYFNTLRDEIDDALRNDVSVSFMLKFERATFGLLRDWYAFSSKFIGSSEVQTIDDKEVTTISIEDSGKPNPLFGFSDFQYFTSFTVESATDIFDAVGDAEPLQPINALPFRAYEFIHNYFFRNERVAPFMLDGKPQYNEFITNSGSGADETTPLEFFNALYEYDYFTTCVKEPQFGKAPLVGVTVNDLSDTGILTFQGEATDDSFVVKIPIGQDGTALPLTVYKGTADDTTIHRLNELISFGISINDLRNVSSFQRMLERYQRSGHKYANVVYEFFGTNPPIGDHYPTYLGGFNANMSVQKITNMALSKDAKLGEFAGQGRVSGKGRKIRCFCSEPCYVIGILYFSVTPVYSQYLPKHFIKSELLDYLVNPDFATLSPQPVYKKELAPTQVNPDSFNAVFGYQRPYADYVASFDEAHGLFKTTLSNFLLQRKFLIPPSLNRSFIEVRSDDLLNIFSVVEDEDKLYGQVYFDARVSLPLPRSYSPRSI